MKRMVGRGVRLSTHYNTSINVAQINSQLDVWEHFEGWKPDVIVIDYADILAPEPEARGKDKRQEIDITWRALRRLSQQRNALVITATQADADSFTAQLLTNKNFSENRQKFDHLTLCVGLNQTDAEKPRRYKRCNIIAARTGAFDPMRQVVIPICLEIGNPHIGSFWLRHKKKKKKKKGRQQ